MSKETKFFLEAPYVDIDGTYSELREVFIAHPQSETTILHQACESISEYICFCMNSSIYYKNIVSGKYEQLFLEQVNIDKTDWKLVVRNSPFPEIIFSTDKDDNGQYTSRNYKDINKFLRMKEYDGEKKKDYYKNSTSKKRLYPYEMLFRALLDGIEFK